MVWVTYDDFIHNQELLWKYSFLTKNIPLEYIKNNLDKKWDWNYISENVSSNNYIENPNLPWYKYGLSINKSLTIKYIPA